MTTSMEAVLLAYAIRKSYVKDGVTKPEKYELTFLGATDRRIYKFYVDKPIWLDEMMKDGIFLKGILEMNMQKNDFKSREFGDAYSAYYLSFNDREQVELSPA